MSRSVVHSREAGVHVTCTLSCRPSDSSVCCPRTFRFSVKLLCMSPVLYTLDSSRVSVSCFSLCCPRIVRFSVKLACMCWPLRFFSLLFFSLFYPAFFFYFVPLNCFVSGSALEQTLRNLLSKDNTPW